MSIRVAINGFGRIGRLTFRLLHSRRKSSKSSRSTTSPTTRCWPRCSSTTATTAASRARSSHDAENLTVDGKKIRALAVSNPAELPWKELSVDVVVESTGIFTARAKDGKPGYDTHLQAGAKRVVLSAPAKDGADLTCVLGVNDDKLTPELKCISNASCTTNCLAPVAKVINDNWGIEKGLMTTVPRLHERSERAGPAAPGSVSRPRRGDQHHPHHHRRGRAPSAW